VINRIIDLALGNRLLVLLLTALVCVGGVVAYQQMPKDIYPDLNAPLVNVITTCPGMAAEDVERLITFPLESLMSGTPHVTRVRSESTTGESVVTVEFDWGTDIYLARQIVAGKLEIVAEQLPLGASRPTMGAVSSRMGEIFEFAVVGEGVDPMELRTVADWTIRYRLLGVEGVSFVINLGGFVREYQVFLKPEMLHHYRISIAEVKEAIEKSNRNFSGGIITKKNQELLIQGLGRIESITHIQDTVITSRNNIPVFVKDVADVKVGGRFRRGDAGFSRRTAANDEGNGSEEAVSVVVEKQYGGNTLATIANVQKFLSDLRRHISAKVSVVPYYDQSRLIVSALDQVGTSMLQGAVLVALVILFFLGNVRASLVASLIIPVCVLFSLILMYLGDVSLTVMALGGLAIGIGEMATGSVIMVESIAKHFQTDERDASPLELAAAGAKEVGAYLTPANVIIVLVFVPLLTLEGIAGRMYRPTVFAVGAALLGSLILCITLNPVLMSLCMRKGRRPTKGNPLVTLLTRIYAAVLKRSFRVKWLVLLVALAILGVAGVCYQRLGNEFVPFLDEGSIVASTVMLPETSLEESVRIGKKVEEILLSFPEVVSVCRTTGMAEAAEHVHPVNHSHYMIDLQPLEKRERGYLELTQAMRAELDKIPGIVYIFEQPIANKMAEMLTGIEGQISVKLFGPDLKVLNAKVREIRDVMSRVEGIADLQIEQTTGIPLVLIRLDREALARHGIKVEEVADLVETALNGVGVTDVREAERSTTVLLRLPEEYRQHVETIEDLLVDTPSGNRVPLSQIACIERSEGPQTIFREGLMRRKIILSNVIGRDIGRFVEEAEGEIRRSVQLPQGYDFEFGGQFESQQKTMRQLMWMMLVVALGVVVVLFATLGSFRQSVLLLLNIPMTLSGAIVALLLTGQTLNVSSVIGFIGLFGIALENGVVLVGRINDLRKEGMELHQAVIEGSVSRFRPILMTELILILGVLPLALGMSLVPAPVHEGFFGVIPLALEKASGAEIHRPLAVVYIGGFIVAIFFEQIVLPILYEMFARLKRERFLEQPA
jgi:cobalt-zinc-cadmium resistance protein CzcA